MLRCCWSKIQKLWGFFTWFSLSTFLHDSFGIPSYIPRHDMCPPCCRTHDHIICSPGATYTRVCWLHLFRFCLEDCRILWSECTVPNRIPPESLKWLYCTSENATCVLEVKDANTTRVFEWMVPSRKLPEFWNAGTNENTTSSLKRWYQRDYYQIFEVLVSMRIPPAFLK